MSTNNNLNNINNNISSDNINSNNSSSSNNNINSSNNSNGNSTTTKHNISKYQLETTAKGYPNLHPADPNAPKERWQEIGRKGAEKANRTRTLQSVARAILERKPNIKEINYLKEMGDELTDEADVREVMLLYAKNYAESGNVKWAELFLKASGEMPKDNQVNIVNVDTSLDKMMELFAEADEIE